MVHDLSGIADAKGWAVQFSPAVLENAADGGQALQLWRSNPLLSTFLVAEHRSEAGNFRVVDAARPRWEMILTGLESELRDQDPGADQAMRSYLFLLLLEVARAAGDVEGTLMQRREPILAHTFGVIEKRFGRPLSTGDVADAVGMSSGHLTTLVRERTGRTVGDWILERRMTEARWLLTSTDLTVETISGRVGFTDPAYFNRRFRELHGTPPGSWRRR
jgi:AraC-like DNA-binding protein